MIQWSDGYNFSNQVYIDALLKKYTPTTVLSTQFNLTTLKAAFPLLDPYAFGQASIQVLIGSLHSRFVPSTLAQSGKDVRLV